MIHYKYIEKFACFQGSYPYDMLTFVQKNRNSLSLNYYLTIIFKKKLHKHVLQYIKLYVHRTLSMLLCVELYGFDILVDDKLKPWLLEVNLSPSLGIDSALDCRIKSSMICDLFTLIGIPVIDPTVFGSSIRWASWCLLEEETYFSGIIIIVVIFIKYNSSSRTTERRPKSDVPRKRKASSVNNSLNGDEKRLLLHTIDQNRRSRGFIRIFPTSLTWKKYSSYLGT